MKFSSSETFFASKNQIVKTNEEQELMSYVSSTDKHLFYLTGNYPSSVAGLGLSACLYSWRGEW